MRLLVTCFVIFFSTTVFSREKVVQYDVETSIYKNGKRISSPHMMVLEGEPGKTITSSDGIVEWLFELVASDNSKNSLKGTLIEMKVENRNDDGSMDKLSPNIIINNKKRSKIKLVADSGNKYSIYVKAQKIEHDIN